ncbi:hypothetical protein [Enterobacter hormaechei]|uniref:hypothetical protein n=1 Tax=Enterobacter hormaechei TaxID=158836 RepID=UPI000CEC3024|nr:hypothetical protein [Enterobacter hormaechei]ROC77464.1 hypothetical protein C4Z25_014825 [Enterobacter hormaechei subsp. steigerwaltii]
MSDNFVVVSTVHPVAGRLYLRMIEESSVGLPDVYLITDDLEWADVYKAGWRRKVDKADSHELFSDWFIKKHLTAVEWHDDSIERLAERHAVSVSDLCKWCNAVRRWHDLPVSAVRNEDRNIWRAVSADLAHNTSLIAGYRHIHAMACMEGELMTIAALQDIDGTGDEHIDRLCSIAGAFVDAGYDRSENMSESCARLAWDIDQLGLRIDNPAWTEWLRTFPHQRSSGPENV